MVRRARRPLWQRLPPAVKWSGFAFLFLGLLGGIFVLVQWLAAPRGEETLAQDAEIQSEILVVEEDQPLDAIVRRTVEAMGGFAALSDLTSLRKRGTLWQGEQPFAVDYHFKEPALLRYRLQVGNNAMVLSHNGEIAWRLVELNRVVQPWQPLSPTERVLMQRNAEMSRPVSVYLEQTPSLTKLPDVVVEAHPCFVIAFDDSQEARQVFYIDKTDYLIRKRERLDRSESTPDRLLEVIYRDYREVDGLQIAFEEHVFVNGAEDNRFVMTAVEVNPGVLSSYFNPPPAAPVDAP